MKIFKRLILVVFTLFFFGVVGTFIEGFIKGFNVEINDKNYNTADIRGDFEINKPIEFSNINYNYSLTINKTYIKENELYIEYEYKNENKKDGLQILRTDFSVVDSGDYTLQLEQTIAPPRAAEGDKAKGEFKTKINNSDYVTIKYNKDQKAELKVEL